LIAAAQMTMGPIMQPLPASSTPIIIKTRLVLPPYLPHPSQLS
jgi:hypothetical protein